TGSSPDEGIIDGTGDLQPDVVLLVLPRQTEEALRTIASLSGQVDSHLVVLTDGFDRSWAGAALRSGARALLASEATSAEILAAIEAVSVGLVVLPGAGTDAVVPESPARPHVPPLTDARKLTPREIEILGMIAEGLGNKEIAWKLEISDHTV